MFLPLGFSLSDYSDIEMYVEDISPDVIYPGDNVNIFVRVLNDGTSPIAIEDISLKLPRGMEFVSQEPLNINKNLCGKCSLQVRYRIKISPLVNPGIHTIEFYVKTKDYTIKYPYTLYIEGTEDIFITILSSKGKINSNGKIILNITNIGEVDLEDIKIYLNSNLVLLDKDGFIYIKELKRKKNKILKIPLKITKDASEGINLINLTVAFKGNSKHIRSYTIPIEVYPNPEIYVSSISLSDKPYVNKKVKLILRVENGGYGKVKNLSVYIDGNIEYVQNKFYLGSLDSEEDSSAIFIITPKEENSLITYTIYYKVNDTIKSLQGNFEFKSENNFNYLPIGIVLLILAFLGYMYKSRIMK